MKKKSKRSGAGAKRQKLNKQKGIVILAFIAVFAALGTWLLVQSQAAPRTRGGTATQGVQLYLTPSSGSYAIGGQVTLDVRLNLGTKSANAIDTEVLFPTGNFRFNSVNGNDSPFGLKVMEEGKPGTVRIVRGSTSPVTGDVKIASITLDITGSGRPTITFGGQSVVADATTYTNILQNTTSATYKISK